MPEMPSVRLIAEVGMSLQTRTTCGLGVLGFYGGKSVGRKSLGVQGLGVTC